MSNARELEDRYGSGFYKKYPFEIVRGKGAEIWTVDGKKLIDCFGGHAVVNAGHCPERVVAAIKRQAEQLIHTFASITHAERARLHENLAKITPPHLVRSFLSNSGTEAVECALKVALARRRGVKAPEFVAFKRAFHGRSLGALSFTFNPQYRNPYRGFLYPRVKFASYGNLDSVKSLVNENTVGLIVELVQGEGGVHLARPGFPEGLQEICNENDVAFIVDEVQTGFGRTGKMFAFEHFDVEPDLVSMAKGIASGVPMGATIGREDFMGAVKPSEHASTFGGAPLACAAANATIETLLEDRLVENAAEVGSFLLDGLGALVGAPGYSKVKEVRGAGLMIGVQCKTKVAGMLREAYERGVLALTAGVSTLRLLPPLCLSHEQARVVLDVLKGVLHD
ncbi:MAG: aspartate aminotransferase family protein [Promethearchaeota archaeon]